MDGATIAKLRPEDDGQCMDRMTQEEDRDLAKSPKLLDEHHDDSSNVKGVDPATTLPLEEFKKDIFHQSNATASRVIPSDGCIGLTDGVHADQSADSCDRSRFASPDLIKKIPHYKRKFSQLEPPSICGERSVGRKSRGCMEGEGEVVGLGGLDELVERLLDEEGGITGSIEFCLNMESDMCEMYVPPTQEVELKTRVLSGLSFIVTGLHDNQEIGPKRAKEMIVSHGGTITNYRVLRRGNGRKFNTSQTILISEKPQRNYKYIRALAQAVPCVHYLWLTRTLSKNKLQDLNKYLLPAGYNLNQELIPIPNWTIYENISEISEVERLPFGKFIKDNLFDSYRIEVVGSNEFRTQWSTLLRLSGAIVVNRLGLETSRRIDYVVSDSFPTEFTIAETNRRNLRMLSKEWVIQTIIQRQIQNPDSSDLYIIKTH